MKAAHRSTSSKETSSCSLPQRGTTYRRWNSESMEKAVKEVKLGMPIRQACEIFSVPKSSLHDRVSDKVDYKARSGPTPYLYYQHGRSKSSYHFHLPTSSSACDAAAGQRMLCTIESIMETDLSPIYC